ncbi:MAG: acyl-[acyl-carrier-protein] thioesterase [Anaerovoracaceae bacterium]|jgi:medium-chain acyl-[acyl-carrier-protein] hydrolase
MKLTDEAFFHSYRIKFSDISENGTLRPSHLLDYLQDLSMIHSGFCGYDSDYFVAHETAWAIIFWHIEIETLPRENEVIELSTWDKQLKRTQAHREIEAHSRDGRRCCRAYARNVLTDTARHRPKPITPDFFAPYYFPVERPFPDAEMPTSVPLPDREPDFTAALTVQRSDLDPSGHVNNAVYLDWAENCVPDEIYNHRRLADIKIMYKHECFRGTRLALCCTIEPLNGEEAEAGAQRLTVAFRDGGEKEEQAGRLYAAVAMEWR